MLMVASISLPGGVNTEKYSYLMQEMVKQVLFYKFPENLSLDTEMTQSDFLLSWNTLTDITLSIFTKKETTKDSDI
jgi:hypothetical protein